MVLVQTQLVPSNVAVMMVIQEMEHTVMVRYLCTQTYKEMEEPAGGGPVKACRNLLELAGTCWNLQGPLETCKSL